MINEDELIGIEFACPGGYETKFIKKSEWEFLQNYTKDLREYLYK